ncbi:hypothetical protein [Saccharothrix coeruleofusca]|uniref:hypothetical protein n=1 Tax=Saccharothrix coeruleofusca TaxID=33919 RepID=UPI0016707170|nr:hypothetical protein [Saccharothrix coeruleofusca]MBP2338717.1 hypothetical protein [Saccharothrix coeruleofusca]
MDQVVVDIGTRDSRRVVVGGVVALFFGLSGLAGAVIAFRDGEPVGGSVALVIGLVLTAIPVLVLVSWKKVSRPRLLVLEVPGVRWDDPQGTPWAVPWHELSAVSVSRTRERVTSLATLLLRKTMVRLDLFPADPNAFRARHPGMAHLARPDGRYRVPLGDAARLVPVLDRAATRYAPRLYRGVQDEGFTVGLT